MTSRDSKGSTANSENEIPRPPLPPWIEWIWKLLQKYRLLRQALLVLAVIVGVFLIPLVDALILTLGARVGETFPAVDEARRWYVGRVQDGFEVLHSRIDYVQTFDLELSTDRTRQTLATDIEPGQELEVLLDNVKVIGSIIRAPPSSNPIVGDTLLKDERQTPPECTLVRDAKGTTGDQGVLMILLNDVQVRQRPFGEASERISVRVDSRWWREHWKAFKNVGRDDPLGKV